MDQYKNQYKGKKIFIPCGAGCVGSNLTKALNDAEAARDIGLHDLSSDPEEEYLLRSSEPI